MSAHHYPSFGILHIDGIMDPTIAMGVIITKIGEKEIKTVLVNLQPIDLCPKSNLNINATICASWLASRVLKVEVRV
ncbi:hypothetical protein BB560_006896 [Smittium megazygosporum]|uniref:Uncharacterized protein n=1 Tax=Smittium megazygosporum TaxID=133381 RepID=A0A2T9Y0D8_9FUNG|nr:hypothetical protein BB560_006896 [Smittium megazygosporum]